MLKKYKDKKTLLERIIFFLFLGVFTLFYYARKNQNDKKILGQKLYIYLLLRVIKLFYYEKNIHIPICL
jgi:hypothetical protein